MEKFKNIYLASLLVLISQVIFAQQIGNLEGINYQAVAIDENGKEIVGMDVEGKPLYEKTIGVRFTILKGSNGPILYQETQTALTDQYGLFSLVIGHGELTGAGMYDTLMNIPWIDADQFLKVEIAIKNDGDYKLVSLQKFMTVPYSFYTDDIADNAITTAKILNETILAEDIDTGAVTTSEILDETILAEDIGTGSVETSEILDGTILNEDIANSTIDLTAKVTAILPVPNGGTGVSSSTNGGILVGGGTGPISDLGVAASGELPIGDGAGAPVLNTLTAGTGISIINGPGTITITSTVTGVNSNVAGTVPIGTISNGTTFISGAIPVTGVQFGDIVLASIDTDLRGCIMRAYVFSSNNIKVAIFNGTGAAVNLGTVSIKVMIVQ